jgi:hypothetical protein
MVSGMHEPHFLVLLSSLIIVATTLFILSLTQQDTLAQRQQIPGIKYDATNTSTTTLSNTTVMPEFGSDIDNKNNVSDEPCNMPPCPPGEMCIQVCPETELQ